MTRMKQLVFSEIALGTMTKLNDDERLAGSTKLTLWFTVCQSKFSGVPLASTSLGMHWYAAHSSLYTVVSGRKCCRSKRWRRRQCNFTMEGLFRRRVPYDVGDFDNAGVYPWRGHDETLPELVTV
ncbi:hypothetical protein HPB51_003735 [Rhipicephalus microplus]|uniref:Uncharacterized protein n=1 Tax=Rhipicephalus microplus TaxID=6941 RepID=A0A9J6EXB6_RHIMP|nr:hypothetical protein HPB51_003735 [Rhipicephalus microplus]